MRERVKNTFSETAVERLFMGFLRNIYAMKEINTPKAFIWQIISLYFLRLSSYKQKRAESVKKRVSGCASALNEGEARSYGHYPI